MARFNIDESTIQMEWKSFWDGATDPYTYYFFDAADESGYNRVRIYKASDNRVYCTVTDNNGAIILNFSKSIANWTNYNERDQIFYQIAFQWKVTDGILDEFYFAVDGIRQGSFVRSEENINYEFYPDYKHLYLGSSINGEYICHSALDTLHISNIIRTEEDLRLTYNRIVKMFSDNNTLLIARYDGTTLPNNETFYGLDFAEVHKKESQGFEALIQIANPLNKQFDQDALTHLIQKLKPAHTKIFVEYV